MKLRRAIRAYGEVTVDFSAVKKARSCDAETVLQQLQQFAQERRHENGAVATLTGLNGSVVAQIEKLVRERFDRATVLRRDFTAETGTYTLKINFPQWSRDPVRRQYLQQLIDRDGPTCVWCGIEMDVDDRRASLDHILTQKAGGVDHIDDLVLACEGCNGDRGDLTADEWLQVIRTEARRRRFIPNLEAIERALERSAAFHQDNKAVAAVVPIRERVRRQIVAGGRRTTPSPGLT